MDGAPGPSPFSTGGGGYEYERMVGAVYLAAMIRGSHVPGVDGAVTRVRFQQRGAGHLLDDLVVEFDGDGASHSLSLQVKHGLRVGTSQAFKDLIADCWKMYTGQGGGVFDPSSDRLGIVVPHVSTSANDHCLPVLELARSSEDGSAFWASMTRDDHSQDRNRFVDAIKSAVVDTDGPAASCDTLWRFLRSLYIIVLDMGGPAAAGRSLADEICLGALSEPAEGDKDKLFDALRGVAADLAPKGGSIKTAALRRRLSTFGLRCHARTEADAGRLAAHSRTVMDGIKNNIAGTIYLGRAPLLEKLEKTAGDNAITILHGEPFAGKSALAKMLAEKAGPGAVLFFGAEYMDGGGGDIGAFLSLQGVRGDLDAMLETYGAAPRRYVVIDGIDRIAYEPARAKTVEGLVAAVLRYNAEAAAPAGGSTEWKIIATARSARLDDVAGTVGRWCGRRPAALEVSPLSEKEIDEVRRQAPSLAGVLKGRLGGLLTLPGYLDMAAGLAPAFSGDVQGAIGEGWLFDRFWNEAVLRRGGMRDGKGHGLDREKILTDMAVRAYEGRPPADLRDLDRDAVEGLLGESLARRVGDHLAFVHDVIEEYAMARAIGSEESRRLLFKKGAESRKLFRPLRICAAKMLEVGGSVDQWESLHEDCRRSAGGEVLARECLLGIADSDAARQNLDAASGALLKDGGALLARLLAALPSAFLKDNPLWAQAVEERGGVHTAVDKARHGLPRDERFSPVLSFALDRMDSLGDDTVAEFIRTAAKWSFSGADLPLKRRIADYAAQHAGWLRGHEGVLGQGMDESDETKGLIAAIILYSSDAAPELVEELVSASPPMVNSRHFRRGLIQKGGWIHLCKFLPKIAVDVLSRTMCTSSISPMLTHSVPGTRDDGWTYMASPTEGPFYPFLVFHSEYGLELVHKLLNHATEQWRRAQEAGNPLHPPRIPLPQTMLLGDQRVEVYGDEHAFAWCGHTGLAPDLVASALMALELWLDRQIERGEEAPAALFGRVLRATRSAAVVGVCCAVALKHKVESAEAVLPMLANPAFWIMDAKRMESDMQANNVIRMQAGLFAKDRTMKEKYEQAMRRVAKRHGAGLLSMFVPLLLFGGPDSARAKVQEDLGAFPDRIPVFFEDDVDDKYVIKLRHRYCKMWSRQADRDNYTYSATSKDTFAMVFDETRFLTDDEKRAERQRQDHKKVLDFLMWSHALLEENKIGPSFTVESALGYAAQIAKDYASSMPSQYVTSAADARANFAGALIVRRWDEMAKAGMADACLKSFEETANAFDPRAEDKQLHPYGADRAVARALPYYHLRGGRGAKKAIRRFADAYNAEVLGNLMHGIRALWGHEDGLALECIEKARRRFCGQKDAFGRPYTDWAGYAAVLPALHGVPSVGGGTGRRLDRIVDGMLDDTIEAFKGFERSLDYGGMHLAFHNAWCPRFFRILDSYAAGRPKLCNAILAKIASHWEAAPPLLEAYMRWTLLSGAVAGRKDRLLATWKKILPMVAKSKFAAGYRNEAVKKSILSLLLFVDPSGVGASPERLGMLGEFADGASAWCEAFAGRKDAIEIAASILDSASPTLLLEHGIGWLWTLLQPADLSGLSGHTVKLLSQLLHDASTCERPSGGLPDLRDKYAWLVDSMVALNDPAAESLRDGGENPYEDVRGPRRR